MGEHQDAKAAAAEALRNVDKTTHLPRPLRFLTGEAVLIHGRVAARKPWADA